MIKTDVLIIGAGPVGLISATLLRRLGFSCVVAERRPELHQAPQAHVVSARTMEIFRAAGVPDGPIREASTPPADMRQVVWVQSLAGLRIGALDLFKERDIRFMLENTTSPPANVSQHLLEPILLRAAEAAGAEIRFDSEWQAFEQDEDGVTSVVIENGARVEIRSDYLLGCDGAGSRVRKALGIELIGPAALQHMVNLFFKADLRELVGDCPGILYWIVDPVSTGVFIAHHIDSTWVFGLTYDPAQHGGEIPDEAFCRDRLAGAIGQDVDLQLCSMDPWVMTAQVAERFQDGRVLLIGDAAHRFPPTGGLGMNTGVSDAFNLAWKLAALRSGGAGAGLLETYSVERRPMAQLNSDESARNFFKMIEVIAALELPQKGSVSEVRASISALERDPERRARVQGAIDAQRDHFDTKGLDFGQSYESGALISDGSSPPEIQNRVRDYVPNTRPGARLPHAWLEHAGKLVSTHDLVGPGEFVLFSGRRDSGWEHPEIRTLCVADDGDARDPDGRWTKVRGVGPEGAILVRPDRHIAFRAAERPADPRAVLDGVMREILFR